MGFVDQVFMKLRHKVKRQASTGIDTKIINTSATYRLYKPILVLNSFAA